MSISQVSHIRLYMLNRDYGIKTVYIHRTLYLHWEICEQIDP